MSHRPQDNSATTAPSAERNARTLMSLPSPPPPATTVPEKSGFDTRRDRLQDRQARLSQHQASVMAEIQKLTTQLDAIPEDHLDKRLAVRGKIKAFEEQLQQVAEEQASLDSQKEEITRQEQQAQVEEASSIRQALQKKGRDTGDVIRHIVVELLDKNFANWREFKDQERIAQDTLRSLAPEKMTYLPTFSYATAIDQNFEMALASVIAAARRSQGDIYSRTHATDIQNAKARALKEASEADLARRAAQNEELKNKAGAR